MKKTAYTKTKVEIDNVEVSYSTEDKLYRICVTANWRDQHMFLTARELERLTTAIKDIQGE